MGNIDEDHILVKREGNDAQHTVNRDHHSSTNPPTTPTSRSGQRKIESPAVSSVSPSSSKRKRLESSQGTPSRSGIGSKWSPWEDRMIMEAVISAAAKAVDWYALMDSTNEKRGAEDQRTMNGLRLHWRNILKPKSLE